MPVTDLQQLNFEDLRRLLLDRTDGERAAKAILTARDGRQKLNLSELLRHHDDAEVVEPREIELREGVDALLDCHGAMEIAHIVRFIPSKMEGPFWEQCRAVLNEPNVRRYYEQHYPLRLPALLRERLDAPDDAPREREDPRATALFQEFIGYENHIRADEELQIVLGMLDDYWIGEVGFENVANALTDQAHFVRRCRRSPKKRTTLDHALHGFQKLVICCLRTDALLQRAAEFPLLQTALWSYYEYWFVILREQFGSNVPRALSKMLAWQPELLGGGRNNGDDEEAITPAQARAEVGRFVDEATRSLRRLTDGGYGEALKPELFVRIPPVAFDPFQSPQKPPHLRRKKSR